MSSQLSFAFADSFVSLLPACAPLISSPQTSNSSKSWKLFQQHCPNNIKVQQVQIQLDLPAHIGDGWPCYKNVAFSRSGQTKTGSAPSKCSKTCQRHSDAVAWPPGPSSSFESSIRGIFGGGAAGDAGRRAILRRVALVDPGDPFPCARWIGGHGSPQDAPRATLGTPAWALNQHTRCADSCCPGQCPALPSRRNFDGLDVADGAVILLRVCSRDFHFGC